MLARLLSGLSCAAELPGQAVCLHDDVCVGGGGGGKRVYSIGIALSLPFEDSC